MVASSGYARLRRAAADDEHAGGVRTQGGREYTHPNLNERLISCGDLVAGFQDVTLAAARVEKLHRMLVIDLLSQPVHVNLDRV